MSDERFNVLWTAGMNWFGWYLWGEQVKFEEAILCTTVGVCIRVPACKHVV